MARNLPQTGTKTTFGQSTNTSINLDTSGFLLTLFVVGKNFSLKYSETLTLHDYQWKYFEILHNLKG